MAGYLKEIRPKTGKILRFQYDPEQCELTGGVGGWNETARPRHVAGTEYGGTPLYRVSFMLMMDGYVAGKSIEPSIALLEGWGQPHSNSKEPSVLQLVYATYSRLRWVIDDVQVSSTLRRGDGHRVQAWVQVNLIEYRGLTSHATAVDSVRAQIIANNDATGNSHKNPTTTTYTVVKGDTLMHIAAKKLGNASRWKEIATLNKIKDPYHLHVGAKLKLPAK